MLVVEMHEVLLCRAQLASELREQWAHCSALEALLDFQSNQQLSIEMSWIHSIYHILSSRDTTTTRREITGSHTLTWALVKVTAFLKLLRKITRDTHCSLTHTVLRLQEDLCPNRLHFFHLLLYEGVIETFYKTFIF